MTNYQVKVNTAGPDYCACTCTLVFYDKGNLRYKSVDGFADAHRHNTDSPYNLYLAAMAETRARSRAYRNALGLNVVSADETAKDPLPKDEELEPITENQIGLIERSCSKHDINVKKFINSGAHKYEVINVVSRDTGARMLQELNKYQQTNSEKKTVSPVIAGYDKNWRDDFYDSKKG